jgi:DNA-binding CsgD family transcriptional regulator
MSPLRDQRQELGADLSGVMLTMIDPANRPAISTENVAQLYRLSEAESEVCRLLIDGLTQNDIADSRNVSPETVKTQIQSVYRKTRTSGRADLIRLVVDINPPIDGLGGA